MINTINSTTNTIKTKFSNYENTLNEILKKLFKNGYMVHAELFTADDSNFKDKTKEVYEELKQYAIYDIPFYIQNVNIDNGSYLFWTLYKTDHECDLQTAIDKSSAFIEKLKDNTKNAYKPETAFKFIINMLFNYNLYKDPNFIIKNFETSIEKIFVPPPKKDENGNIIKKKKTKNLEKQYVKPNISKIELIKNNKFHQKPALFINIKDDLLSCLNSEINFYQKNNFLYISMNTNESTFEIYENFISNRITNNNNRESIEKRFNKRDLVLINNSHKYIKSKFVPIISFYKDNTNYSECIIQELYTKALCKILQSIQFGNNERCIFDPLQTINEINHKEIPYIRPILNNINVFIQNNLFENDADKNIYRDRVILKIFNDLKNLPNNRFVIGDIQVRFVDKVDYQTLLEDKGAFNLFITENIFNNSDDFDIEDFECSNTLNLNNNIYDDIKKTYFVLRGEIYKYHKNDIYSELKHENLKRIINNQECIALQNIFENINPLHVNFKIPKKEVELRMELNDEDLKKELIKDEENIGNLLESAIKYKIKMLSNKVKKSLDELLLKSTFSNRYLELENFNIDKSLNDLKLYAINLNKQKLNKGKGNIRNETYTQSLFTVSDNKLLLDKVSCELFDSDQNNKTSIFFNSDNTLLKNISKDIYKAINENNLLDSSILFFPDKKVLCVSFTKNTTPRVLINNDLKIPIEDHFITKNDIMRRTGIDNENIIPFHYPLKSKTKQKLYTTLANDSFYIFPQKHNVNNEVNRTLLREVILFNVSNNCIEKMEDTDPNFNLYMSLYLSFFKEVEYDKEGHRITSSEPLTNKLAEIITEH